MWLPSNNNGIRDVSCWDQCSIGGQTGKIKPKRQRQNGGPEKEIFNNQKNVLKRLPLKKKKNSGRSASVASVPLLGVDHSFNGRLVAVVHVSIHLKQMTRPRHKSRATLLGGRLALSLKLYFRSNNSPGRTRR